MLPEGEGIGEGSAVDERHEQVGRPGHERPGGRRDHVFVAEHRSHAGRARNDHLRLAADVIPGLERKIEPQFRHHVGPGQIFSERHEVTLEIRPGEPFAGVEQERRLEDLARPFAVAPVDAAAEQHRAEGIGQRPQAPLRLPRATKHKCLVGERVEPLFVRSAAALGPDDEIRQRQRGARLAGEPLQDSDRVVPIGISLHEHQSQAGSSGHAGLDPADGDESIDEIGCSEHDRRYGRDRWPPPGGMRHEAGERDE